ncbi:hypothetical protein VIBNISOn1_1420032 [Vibrio nigripulchritudo SOn1]|uniref:Uncharacterized protein n=1 Tax=Vibrio nigripulchritudo SOn1 TaxID=1238450 RepID=A0AAV2VKL3_9VIBR|nr:hypothetical protein VIBNISOn1_1420032 [Vibrio nigripulchritudo SOn1]
MVFHHTKSGLLPYQKWFEFLPLIEPLSIVFSIKNSQTQSLCPAFF